MSEWIDLGDDHEIMFVSWKPDRELNPAWNETEDVEKYGADVRHKTPSGAPCLGYILFDSPTAHIVNPGVPMWQVESWEPLTLSPSLLCSCGDHGFIKQGRWVRA